jgi:predicted transcriptional regulator
MSELSRREKEGGWYWIENDLMDIYGEYLGHIAIGIYNSLKRHENKEEIAFPSQALIAKEINASRKAINEHIRILEKYRLIVKKKTRSGKGSWRNNTYFITDRSEWLSPSNFSALDHVTQGYMNKTNTKKTNNKNTKISKERVGKVENMTKDLVGKYTKELKQINNGLSPPT